MRILVVSQYFWPEEFRINDLVEGLIARGHQVTVLTNPPNYPGGEIFPAWREKPEAFTKFGGANIVRVPVVARGSRSFTLVLNYLSFVISACVLGAWKLRRQSFDAVLCFQTSPVTVALPALLLGRLKRAPVTMWILDLWPESLAAVGAVKNPALLRAVSGLVRFIYRRLDRVLLASQAFRDSVMKHGAKAEKVEYFPNWVEPEFLGLKLTNPAPEVEAVQGVFNIVFAGNIGEAQDMPALLQAAVKTKDIDGLKWIIVGDGRRAEAVRADIARLDLGDRVFMLGRHPTTRMPEFFAAADALLVTLKDDPIFHVTVPGKVQSYLASGKPVLAMLTGEGARVLQESGGGLTSPAGNNEALASSVRTMMAMTKEERQAMAAAGKRYCMAHYSRSDLMDRLECWLVYPLGVSGQLKS